ncbi:MAG: universal stress protein [Candidatus Aminicenantes bacterium]|nr:MAG: universal stress protein [Candidatus Aminicenantes bacterium]
MSGFLNKILWATDFSEEAQESLLYADAFAKTFKAEIVALHVVPDFSAALYDAARVIKGELLQKMAAVKGEAEEKIKAISKEKGIPFEKIIVMEGTASKIIIDSAEKEGVDLIVIGRRGMSAVEKLFIGSVANQILRTSPVPILLTKKKTGTPQFKKIIVPTDFSEREEIERDLAWDLAKGFGSELTLLHVLELHDFEFSPRVLEELMESLLGRLKRRKTREKADLQVTEDVYRAVNASVGIAEYAETHNFDLIVISTCVQSKLERFFLGSTTEKVISYTQIPIFAIPPTYCLD